MRCCRCHVMERESFEDDATAELLNRGFVSIKVDREERPDVDKVYVSCASPHTSECMHCYAVRFWHSGLCIPACWQLLCQHRLLCNPLHHMFINPVRQVHLFHTLL